MKNSTHTQTNRTNLNELHFNVWSTTKNRDGTVPLFSSSTVAPTTGISCFETCSVTPSKILDKRFEASASTHTSAHEHACGHAQWNVHRTFGVSPTGERFVSLRSCVRTGARSGCLVEAEFEIGPHTFLSFPLCPAEVFLFHPPAQTSYPTLVALTMA